MEPTANLRQAIRDYKNGKTQAFDVLYHESNKYVYTCIYKVMCGNDNVHDAADEIMQNTYLEISRSIPKLENEDRFLQWAGMIATRKCYAYIKKNKKYVLLDEEDDTFDTLADNENIIPETIIQDKEKQRLIREIIERELTEMQKLCIIAFYYNQQKQSEIAQELGIPENTVKTNLSRARAKIKEGILGVEKREGIRLHSVAPFMLLLFREDVLAAVVPQEITKNVLSAVSDMTGVAVNETTVGERNVIESTNASTATAIKGIMGKVSEASLKTKILGVVIITGIVGTVIGATVSGGLFMSNKESDEIENSSANQVIERTWEEEHKAHLFMYADEGDLHASDFDIHDFDEDGIPEMLMYDEIEDGYHFCYFDKNDNRTKLPFSFSNGEKALVGYTDDAKQLVMIWDNAFEIDAQQYVMPMVLIKEYENERLALKKEYRVVGTRLNSYGEHELDYELRELENGTDVCTDLTAEEYEKELEKIKNSLIEMRHVEIEENAIDARFAEFKKNGNDSVKRVNDDKKKEYVENIEVEVSEEERENLRILAQFFTATRWGENLSGMEIKPEEKDAWKFIERLGANNFSYQEYPYDKYLPKKADGQLYSQMYTKEDIREYVENVFGITSSYTDYTHYDVDTENFVYYEAELESADKCEIQKIVKLEDTYRVTGQVAFGEYQDMDSIEPTYIATYDFTMMLIKNEDSPFGYILNRIRYD
ncbi:MAG: sigma-70 family RNA polymerase sigma factor [Lachnospiraceae bacterium]|nr:sigma-70 family RNA polymerase sigma factor [Lachnospiraceae bacterium]